MDAKELTETVEPVPAKPGESVPVIMRRLEAHFHERDVPAVTAPDTKKIIRPAIARGTFEHVLVELRSEDGRRFTKTASTPAACRKLWTWATGL